MVSDFIFGPIAESCVANCYARFAKDDGSRFFFKMEAEQILQERKSRGKKEYLVRWSGKGQEADSWEPADSVPQKIVKMFSSPKKSPTKKSRSRSTSRGRRGRSRSKGRTASKSPSRRKSAPAAAATRQSRRTVETSLVKSEVKTDGDAEVKTESTTSKTETSLQNDVGTVTRTVTEEKEVITKSSPRKTEKPAWKPALPDLCRYYNSDYAMIIVFTCITIITLSFVLENKVDWEMVCAYIKNLFSSLVSTMSSMFSSSTSQSSATEKQ